MKFARSILLASTLATLSVPGQASAQALTYVQPGLVYIDPYALVTWTCRTGTGATCSSNHLANPFYRQILVLPTGYTSSEKAKFFTDVEAMRVKMSDAPGSAIYSEQYRDRILYIAYWVSGGDLSTASSAFGGKIFAHPVRGEALTMNQDAVNAKVNEIRASTIPALAPGAVAVVFDSDRTDVTANATPPSFTRKSYGIARFTRGDAQSSYTPSHEIGHAMLSWVDEYVEDGFENLNITQLDALTPLVLWDGTFSTLDDALGDLLGVYDLNISEILADNGADNVSTSRYPSTVWSGLAQEIYEYEGGMFFGHGTFHDAGKNLMNSNRYNATADNGFDYAHSPSQQRVANTVFNTRVAGRANDRLRNAGPMNAWPYAAGTPTVILFDADKNHRWHPTQRYDVLVGWYERHYYTCWAGFIPYPCYDNVWTTMQKSVTPSINTIDLAPSALYGLASLTQGVVCSLGVGDLSNGIDLCTLTLDQMASAFLPSMRFFLPYQAVTVPASQAFTTYYWAFRTYNGTYTSGWTGWSSFYREY